MKRILFLLVIVFASVCSNAQKQANNWYFGSQAGVDFNSGVPVALNNGQLNTYEGSSSISDQNGNLLFYSDGITVWNSQHQVMANGNGLLGNSSSTQSAMIVQVPGSPNLYYIFVVDVDFSYSIVDMNLNGGLGDISLKNVIVQSNFNGEKLTGTLHGNGFDIWIVIHGTATSDFRAYVLSSAGLNLTPVITSIGFAHGAPYGQMKLSPDGSKIAVGVYNAGFAMELFDFDINTGIVSNNIAIPTVYGQCYGLEFSPDNTKLYGTANPDNTIYQFDLLAGSPAAIIASATQIASLPGFTAAGMQLAPDGKIYISPSGSGFLDVINNPNDSGSACNYAANAVNLNGGICNLGLPGYVSSYFNLYSVENTCLGDTTYFNCGSISGLGGTAWNFDDPASGANNLSYVFNPAHYFSSAGTYSVEMIKYYLNGVIDTAYIQVTISAPPVISLGNDTILCSGTSIQLNAGSGYTGYLWPDGSTDSTFLAVDSGTYVVTVTQGGCTGTDTINIAYQPCASPGVALLASDTSFCGKKCIDFFDLSTNSPTSWLWLFPGADSTSSTLQNPTNICYNSYGSFDVTLIACNAAGCDTLIIPNYINEFQNPPVPVITSSFDTLFCSPAFSYQWCNTTGPIPGETDSFFVYQQQGLYYCIVTDSNGCATSSALVYTGIEDIGGTANLIQVYPNPSSGEFVVSFNGQPEPGEILITDVLGKLIYSRPLSGNETTVRFNISEAADGVYFCRVVSENRTRVCKLILSR